MSVDSLEDQLLHLLRFSGIEKDNLRELVSIVVGLKSNGLGAFRIFPRGIPPVVDGLTVQATVSAANISQILSTILTNPVRLGGVVIFPYGIPVVESFQVNVALGNTVETGAAAEAGA
jgi:hypothetical protein